MNKMSKDFTLDTEFNGYKGKLLSLALWSPEKSLYVVVARNDRPNVLTEWVAEHVEPLLFKEPGYGLVDAYHAPLHHEAPAITIASLDDLPKVLEQFFGGCKPRIHVDWPDDVKFFSDLILTGPGTMINIPGIEFVVHREDSYPTQHVPQALQHHSWWDAFVLYEHLTALQRYEYVKENPGTNPPRWLRF